MKRRNAARSLPKKTEAKYWIEKLGLEPHPEGGYFRQTYKSDLIIEASPVAPPSSRLLRQGGNPPLQRFSRAASTAIYFLLEGEDFSAFHRLRSDELWHFYAGSTLVVHVIDPSGDHSSILLGNNLERGEIFQAVVKAGCWFASEVQDRKSLALVGCTVAPGFEFEDFELARREELASKFPRHKKLLERLTRQ
jgi:uncharacterized protein